jgi:ATP-dependent DNA helicase RecQ
LRTAYQGYAVAVPDDDRLDRLRELARDTFGWEDLRPGQAEPMLAVLEGRDALVVMPTGSGKSAIYQLTALLRPGCTVVVSPLLALQRDQITGIAERGEDAGGAVRVSSAESDRAKEEALGAVRAGDVEFLFLAPEQLGNEEVLDQVAALRPSLVAVDEAHCVSAWGHDFRPDYLRLGTAVTRLGRPPVVALTATASPPVRDDIVERLGLRDPLVVVRGLDRPNIDLEVRRFVEDADKRRAALDTAVGLVEELRGPGLVYAATRRDTEEIAAALAERGLRAAAYHAGLPKKQRDGVHEDFLEDRLDLVVATSAFGMGVDKPNVRFVLHAAVPESPDAYLQEVGRAGRDGEPARAALFYRPEDLGLRRFFAAASPREDDLVQVAGAVRRATSPLTRRALAERTGMPARRVGVLLNLLCDVGAVVERGRGLVAPADAPGPKRAAAAALELAERGSRVEASRLDMMRGYADTTGCRRQFILGYFGDPLDEPCGACDTCRAGTAAPHGDEASAEDVPFDVGERVEHSALGDGTVMNVEEGERVVVLFEDHGYKTLDVDHVVEHGLLEPADTSEA